MQMKFYLYIKKRGQEKVLAMPKGGRKGLEVVLTREPEVLAIQMGGGHKRFYPVLRWRAQQVLDLQFAPFPCS